MKSTSEEGSLSWYAASAAQVIKKLGTNQEAVLDSGEVSERLKKYGPNRLPTGGKRGPLMRFLMQINNVLIYVLLTAAAAIGGVIVLQALFTYAPFMHYIFGSESLPLWIWKWLLLGGVVFFIVVELEKALVRLVYPQVNKTA
jgi:magnesium-transporting ATPase (P-type)